MKKFSTLPDKYSQGDIIQVPINGGSIWDLVNMVDIWDLHSHLYISRENSLADDVREVLRLPLLLLASGRYHICDDLTAIRRVACEGRASHTLPIVVDIWKLR